MPYADSPYPAFSPGEKTWEIANKIVKPAPPVVADTVLFDLVVSVNYPAAKDGGASAPTNCSALAESYVRASGSNVSLGRSDRA